MKKMLFLLVIWMNTIGVLHAMEVKDTVIPNRIIPLAGPGCVISQIDKNLVEVVAGTSDLDYIIDTNPNNYASFRSVAGVTLLYNPILSVKDMNRMFFASSDMATTAGFVIQCQQEGNNLLTADVLQMFWIETFLDGELQEASNGSSSTTTSLLDLNLITVSSDGKTKVSIAVTKPFDEIRIGVAGINADVISNLRIYYAFAGENQIKPITNTQYYPTAYVHSSGVNGIGNEWTTAIWNWPSARNNLVGVNSENAGVGFGVLSNLLTEPRVTINADTIIPANTEVGFLIESGSVLAIDLLKNTVLTTYDANDNEVESKTIVSVLGLSAVGGGKTMISMVTTRPCQQVKIKFGGVNIDVGGTKIFYAYTRSTGVTMSPSCDLKVNADMTLCSGTSVQLTGVSGIQWSIISSPAGTMPTVNTGGLVEGITAQGEYVIQATLGTCTDIVTIYKKPISDVKLSCNRPIVGSNITTYSPAGGGCLLCLATGTNGNVENVINTDLTDYVEYTQGLDLASNTSIFGVQNMQNPYEANAENPIRVGFVMQATNQFLNLDLLKFFVIKTYYKGEEVESSLVEENNAIGADLIGGMDNQVRFSFTATQKFDAVALWTAGLLNLNISKFRIYYAFEENVNDGCFTGNNASACVSLLSSDEFGAQIAYNHTGFGGIANVGAFMTDLGYAIDGNNESYALINKIAGIGGAAKLSVKVNRVIGNGYQAGFIIQDQTWVTNADLLSRIRIKTYLNGVQTGDETGIPSVLSLDLIGSGGKSYVTVYPTQSFDEIQLDLSGLVDAAINTKVFGAFVRKDTDGDGMPDCIDQNICGSNIVPDVVATCSDYPVMVTISGGTEGSAYSLWTGTESYPFINDTVQFYSPSGKFNYTIRESGEDIYANIKVSVHDTLTQWTGAVSNDWSDWDNWTHGVPSGCSDVIIPTEDKLENVNGYYPVLTEGGSYICRGIHFESGAEVKRLDLLTYEKAWIELAVAPLQNQMVFVPLKDTYTGDLFIAGTGSSEYRKPFTPLFGETRRANPTIQARIWDNEWKDMTTMDEKLATSLGTGFSLFVENGDISSDSTFVFRFGKEDTLYHYYRNNGVETSQFINVPRSNIGRFIYEGQDSTVTLPFPQDYKVTSPSGKMFVIGNPFMCHLDIFSFCEVNGDMIEPFIKLQGDSIPASDMNATVKPMEAFWVRSKSNIATLTLTFTKEMQVLGNHSRTELQTRSSIQSESSSQLQPSSLKAYTRNGEGIIESADKVAKLQVFAVSGKLILERQNVTAPVTVPLSEGVNIIKVQTENEVKTFKLIK